MRRVLNFRQGSDKQALSSLSFPSDDTDRFRICSGPRKGHLNSRSAAKLRVVSNSSVASQMQQPFRRLRAHPTDPTAARSVSESFSSWCNHKPPALHFHPNLPTNPKPRLLQPPPRKPYPWRRRQVFIKFDMVRRERFHRPRASL